MCHLRVCVCVFVCVCVCVSQSSTQTITEFSRDKALSAINLTEDQFIDFCILCGCDYASNIKGIGPVRALQLLQVC